MYKKKKEEEEKKKGGGGGAVYKNWDSFLLKGSLKAFNFKEIVNL